MPTEPAVAENITISPLAPEAPLPHAVLHHLYATMLRARLLEQRLRSAVHTGEAILAGTLQNAEATDVIVSATAHSVLEALRGTEVDALLRGNNEGSEGRVVIAEEKIFAGIASGLATAGRRNQSNWVVVAFAPGRLTRGSSFEKATRFAASHRLPLVILADFTDSRRSSRNHDGRNLSHWPFPTIAVDGRDVIAVYRVTREAINAARRGHGPTLVDCVNFLAPGSRGRDQRDPLLSYRGYLQRHNAWSDLWHSDLLSRYKQELGARGRRQKP